MVDQLFPEADGVSESCWLLAAKKSMATWGSEKFEEPENADDIEENFNNILVTHDLQDCLDDSLDLPSFVKIYGQSAEFDYEKYSDEDPPYNQTLHDDNTGYTLEEIRCFS